MTAESFWRGARASAIAVIGALVIGGLTSLGQQYLPPAVNSLSNSAGGWTAFTFLLIWSSRARPALAAVLGILAFEALVAGYDIVSLWRGVQYLSFPSIWMLVGLGAGPVIGLAASGVRYARPVWKVVGVAVLAAILIGEGGYGLVAISATTSPVYWSIQVAAGVVMLVAALLANRLRPLLTLAMIGLTILGAAAFGLLYAFAL